MKPTLRQFIEHYTNDKKDLANGGATYTGTIQDLGQAQIPAGFLEVKNENDGSLRLWFSRKERALIEFSKGNLTIIQIPTMEMFIYEDKHHQNSERIDSSACGKSDCARLH